MGLVKLTHWHIEWNSDLWHRIESGEIIDPEDVNRDDRCEIGKWLIGEGLRYEALSQFRDFKKLHTEYHRCVGRAVQNANHKERREALRSLDEGGECHTLSLALLETAADLGRFIRE